MKTLFTLLFACGLSTLSLAQDDRTPYSTQSLANDAISSVKVSTSAGGIFVSGEAGQQPRIEVYIRDNRDRDLSKDEIKKRLDEDYDMSITVNNHELEAIVKNKHERMNWNESLSVSFKIYVPQQVATDLRTSGGGIHLDNLKGNETFSTSGGGLEINTVNGTIHGTTSGGGIDVKNSGDNINLVTSGGGIRAENCKGEIYLRTSGGGLVLNDLNGNIHATTSGGGVRGSHIEGELVTSTSGGGTGN